MLANNIFNLETSQLDKPIYRIIPVERLFEMVDVEANSLVRTKFWRDPYENFILNSKFQDDKGEPIEISFREDYYGQCWSTRSQSEALWRLYSENKRSVRIRSTARKLFFGLWNAVGSAASATVFIGKVKYQSTDKLIVKAKTMFAETDVLGPAVFASTFFYKRRAFRHEEEVRVICYPISHPRSKLFSYPIDPLELVESIVLDPRLTESEANDLESEIRTKTSYAGTIQRSDLYQPPKVIVVPFVVKKAV